MTSGTIMQGVEAAGDGACNAPFIVGRPPLHRFHSFSANPSRRGLSILLQD